MKKTKILYWAFTGIMALMLGFGSVFNVMSSPESVELFNWLGYPLYLLPFLGVAKLLGIFAILVPGFNRVKEWAYAGLIFDLVGAMYSLMSIGEPVSVYLPLFLPILLVALSYYFHHKLLKAAAHRVPEKTPDLSLAVS
ncbi:DoxX family protein [Rufibacter ruber]|uniref:DoxX family protein n=1 Tax=Rufibacter ruber TaxID=1783499 RepID=UPI00082D0336|nr:DoxX family protein [Rufibacter ruber]